ncbi:MAG: hypothetical protein LBF93_11800 [Zoogloeaceae bacterium]|jgi:predicted O-linked N-acetylglucosamine transferase (SPINDLY family)|nr:hypothetical protein [Zoogloeaceae bacterium]
MISSRFPARSSLDFFDTSHAPYYISAPHYTQKSAGHRALHHLCHLLNELGYEAYVQAHPPKTNPYLRTPLLTQETLARHQATGRTPIVVYPEIISGNPLGQEVVVRWLLNRAGHLGGDKNFRPDDLIFHWDNWMLNGEETQGRLFVPLMDRRIFHDKGAAPENRSGFCYYAHKYLLKGSGKIAEYIIQNGVSLCQDVPLSAEEIAGILRRSKTLYSYDPSAITTEAFLCGCPVVLVMTDYLRQFDLPPPLPGMSYLKASEAEIISSAISPPPVDANAVRAYCDTLERDSLETVFRFIEITQAAVRAQAEKARQPDYRLRRAIDAFNAQQTEEAIARLSPLLDELPQNPLPPAYLAFIAARQGETGAAADFIEMAARIAPERADLRAALGESFLKAGNPILAAKHLEEAISARPDLLEAYPPYAQTLHLTGQDEAALALLQSAATLPSPAQAAIQGLLLEILEKRGDLEAFTRFCLRFSRGLEDELRAARCLSRFDSDGGPLLETLGRAQRQLADARANEPRNIDKPSPPGSPLKIMFLASDFTREARLQRLPALLCHMPLGSFVPFLLINDPRCGHDDCANLCNLLAAHSWIIHGANDARTLELIRETAPDILIDLDAYDPAGRLAVFLKADVSHKFLWGETPLPPLSPECRVLTGARLADAESFAALPCVTLPEMGEYADLPDFPLEAARPAESPARLACLTPASRVGREGWRLFAGALEASPGSTLQVNLQDLGEAARNFIQGEFARHGIAAERLRFVCAHTAEELCRLWREADLGLHPPTDAGDLALPACLWMGRPYLALASPLPWSRRPAALLELAGAEEWIATRPEDYIARVRNFPPAPNPDFRARMRQAGINDPRRFAQGFAARMTKISTRAENWRATPGQPANR